MSNIKLSTPNCIVGEVPQFTGLYQKNNFEFRYKKI